MPYVLIRHKVEDYNKWKLMFDEHSTVRKTAGSEGGYLFRNIDDPNEVVVLLSMDNLEKAQQFIQSDDLRQTMQRAGVTEQPDVYFLDEVERLTA